MPAGRNLLPLLHQYYDSRGIGAQHFACPHRDECQGNAPHFSTAKEAYVGESFGSGALPRLVFLSLDSGDGGEQWHDASEDAAKARSLEALQTHENHVDVHRLPKGRHWYQTRELALTLLQPLKNDLTIETIHRYFAHTNSAKCCLNKAHRAQADRRLFDNCRPFIADELKILSPQILVSQGTWARVAIREGFGPRIGAEERDEAGVGPYQLVSQVGVDPMLWLHSYHPAARAHYWAQVKKDWPSWSATVITRFGRNVERLPRP